MPSRAHVCVWSVVCALGFASTIRAQELTAREVVDIILRESPRAAAIRAEVDVVRRQQSTRTTFPNPGLTYTREGAGFTEFLEVEQPLPLFGSRAALSRAAEAATSTAEAEQHVRLWELRTEAASLVARLLADQARVDATAADVEATARLIEILRIREREGEGSRFDRLRAEQELEDLKAAAVNAAAEAAATRGSLTAMLPPGRLLARVSGSLYDERPAGDLDSLLRRARRTRGELRVLDRAREHAEREAQAARRARLPEPIVSGGLKRADGGSDTVTGAVLGVGLTVPLFDAGGRDAARWVAERAQIMSERTAVEQQVQAEIRQAVDTLRLRRDAVAASGHRDPASDLVTTAEVAYREGEVGILTLIDAFRTAARARLRDIDMRLQARLAQIALERVVGDVLWP